MVEIQWPSSQCGEEVKQFLITQYKEHPELYCIRGGLRHRMMFISEIKFDGYYEHLRICVDCGKEGRYQMRQSIEKTSLD